MTKEAWYSMGFNCGYPRNVIVHNNGNVDETYRERMGYKGPPYSLGDTDMPYLVDRADSIVGLIDFVHERYQTPYKARTQNHALHDGSIFDARTIRGTHNLLLLFSGNRRASCRGMTTMSFEDVRSGATVRNWNPRRGGNTG
jgi:hypothetical protein